MTYNIVFNGNVVGTFETKAKKLKTHILIYKLEEEEKVNNCLSMIHQKYDYDRIKKEIDETRGKDWSVLRQSSTFVNFNNAIKSADIDRGIFPYFNIRIAKLELV